MTTRAGEERAARDAAALDRVRALADAYERYATVCVRDAQTGSSDSPTKQHWLSEAAQARLFVRRIRAAVSEE